MITKTFFVTLINTSLSETITVPARARLAAVMLSVALNFGSANGLAQLIVSRRSSAAFDVAADGSQFSDQAIAMIAATCGSTTDVGNVSEFITIPRPIEVGKAAFIHCSTTSVGNCSFAATLFFLE